MDQRFPGSIRKRRPCFNIFPQIMRVRIDSQQVDVDRKNEFVSDRKVVLSRGYVELVIILKLEKHRQLRRRMSSKVQSEAGLNDFRLPGWLHMRVQDEVRPFVELQSHAFRLNRRNRPRLPEQ